MATQPMEEDTTINDDGSSIKHGKKRSVTEINNGWDQTNKKVADALRRGGLRAKGNDGKSEMQRIIAMCDAAEARHAMVMADLRRQREKLKQLEFAWALD